MAEQVTLQPPVVPPPMTEYRIQHVLLQTLPVPFITIELQSNTLERLVHHYEGNQARQLLTAINKGNFSVNSFAKTVLQRLINDGVLAGNVTGTPE